jgi:PAS domain S-box-containing protein
MRAEAAHLPALADGDEDQSVRARDAGRQIELGIKSLNAVIEKRRTPGGFEKIVALSKKIGDRSFLDPLLATLNDMDSAERERLASRDMAASRAYAWALISGAASAAVGLVALAVFALLLRRSALARDQAAAALAEQRKLLDATLSSIGDAVIATDASGRVTFLNAVAARLTGWSNEEAAGRPLEEVFRIVNEATREPVANPALRALREGTVVGLANHTVLIARDGSERPIDDSAAPIRTGAIVGGAVLVFRDVSQRRRDEEARSRLAAIVESSEDAVVGKTLEGIIQTWNAGAERLFGYTAEEAIGRPVMMLIPPERQDEERLILQRLRRGERIEHFETMRVTKSGRRVEVSLAISPVRDAQGRVVGASKAARDITERKRSEEALRESEERYRRAAAEAARAAEANAKFRTLFEQGAQFAGILTLDGTVVEANRLCLDACGFTREETIGKHFWDCGWWSPSPALQQMVRAACAQAAAGEMFRTETHYFVADGSERWVDLIIAPVTDEAGRVLFLSPTGTDITEKKRAVDELRKQTERLRLLWEAASVLLTTEEPDAMMRGLFVRIAPHFGLHAYFNFMIDEAEGALRLESCMGVPEETGRSIGRMEFGQAICGAVAQSRQPITATRIQQSDDPRVQLVKGLGLRAYTCNPLIAGNRLLGTLSFASRTREEFEPDELEFLRTVCRYVTVAYERLRLVRELRESDRKKDDFIALLAHELRNPLAPIRSGLQIIKLAKDRDVRAGAQEMMTRQLGHMVRLIEDLLDVSRISRNKLELRRAHVTLVEVVRSAVETARPLIDARGHDLMVTLPSEPVHLDADLTRLAQVFGNLLTNSAKYTPEGGEIWLSAHGDGEDVSVSVRDTGIGIPAKALPDVFDMFSQVDRSVERHTGGLGIGLAIVKGLVEMHGGTVTAASEGEGKGSTFTVILPVMADSPDEAASPSGKRQARTRRRILVVDDSRDGAESLAMMLRLMGNDVRTAGDGVEAVERAETFRPDLILMDVGMPRLNGLDATRRIREQGWGKSIRIIAQTGWGQEEDKDRSREAGCDGHLTKPVSPDDLERIMGELWR